MLNLIHLLIISSLIFSLISTAVVAEPATNSSPVQKTPVQPIRRQSTPPSHSIISPDPAAADNDNDDDDDDDDDDCPAEPFCDNALGDCDGSSSTGNDYADPVEGDLFSVLVGAAEAFNENDEGDAGDAADGKYLDFGEPEWPDFQDPMQQAAPSASLAASRK